MSVEFRALLKKVGSGTHTCQDLTRAEAATAAILMLNREATAAQMGAFLIAHRIKRPTGEELAGFLDAYTQLGPQVSAIATESPVVVFSTPYDGRTRTAPVLPVTALLLAAVGCPVLMHGGDRMATKYGVPLVELWQALGVDWTGLSLPQVRDLLQTVGLSFLYMPRLFPALAPLVEIRDQLGKRPPLATLELFWCPYAGSAHLISGYVHPPTEQMLQSACALRSQTLYTTVKGLEGSCDLPRDRTAIIGVPQSATASTLDRLLINARDLGLSGPEIPYGSLADWATAVTQLLAGDHTVDLYPAVVWNSGFYLWHLGPAVSLEDGVDLAKTLLREGQGAQQLQQLQQQVSSLTPVLSHP